MRYAYVEPGAQGWASCSVGDHELPIGPAFAKPTPGQPGVLEVAMKGLRRRSLLRASRSFRPGVAGLSADDAALIGTIANRTTYLHPGKLHSIVGAWQGIEDQSIAVKAGCALGGSTIVSEYFKAPERPPTSTQDIHEQFALITGLSRGSC